ncbi:MAG: VCBS repeat-containing protein [Vicinamibacterales bacterium]
MVLILLTAGLAFALIGTALSGRTVAASCDGGFELINSTTAINPEDVLWVGPDKALLAGGASLSGGRRVARISSFTPASGWTTVLTRAVGTDSGFSAIGGANKTGLWTAGFSQTLDAMRPLAMARTDARDWVERSPGRGGSHGAVLTDIESFKRGTAWAVGYRLDAPGAYAPYALRWADGHWTVSNPPTAKGERGQLSGVSSSKDGGTWVAGSVTRDRVARPYIARRAGGAWQRMSLPDTGSAVLAAIDVPARDVGWAVGYRYARNGIRPLALRWDGSSWSRVAVPVTEGTALFHGVHAHSDGSAVTLVGAAWQRGSGKLRPLIAQRTPGDWDLPSAWTTTTVSGLPTDGLLTSVAGRWVAGRDLNNGLVGRLCSPFEPLASRRAKAADDDAEHELLPLAEPRADLAPARRVTIAASGKGVRLRDVTADVGLPTSSSSYGAVVADFDGDGRDDIFLGAHAGEAALYLDRGERYRKVDHDFGHGDRHGCAAADVDGSGLPDLYCSFGGARGQNVRGNQLVLDPGGPGAMRLAPDAGGASEPVGRGRQVLFLDYDGDGRKDLVLGQQPERVDGLPSMSRVYRRTGPATFSPVIDSGLPPMVGVASLDAGDVDRDGRVDLLMVTNDPKASGRTASIRLFRNTPKGFKPIHEGKGIRSIGERDAVLARLDKDERLDLVQLSGDRIRVSLYKDGRFRTVWERAISDGVAMAVGDADGDGDQDIYVLRRKPAGSSTKDLVLFNRGDGRGFRVVAAPTRSSGSADDVVAIDHDQNGLTDFLALNGINAEGPVSLIAFYRA